MEEPDGTEFQNDIPGDSRDILQMWSLEILLSSGLWQKLPSPDSDPGSPVSTLRPCQNRGIR
jgi:hypothetical protein